MVDGELVVLARGLNDKVTWVTDWIGPRRTTVLPIGGYQVEVSADHDVCSGSTKVHPRAHRAFFMCISDIKARNAPMRFFHFVRIAPKILALPNPELPTSLPNASRRG
jgi:hypothetical protein